MAGFRRLGRESSRSQSYRGRSQVLHDALGKPRDWSWVALQEMKRENCGWGVMPVAAFGELQADQASEAGLL
jgi:hypothetical protein